jgi:hypothetical protein
MRSQLRRLPLIPAIVCAALVATLLGGCARSDRSPSLSQLPLVSGTRVVAMQRVCDRGENAYCALELVVTARGYAGSRELRRAEHRLLERRRWTTVNAPIGQEVAADSRSDRLRVTFAAAAGELEAIDLGWIKRARKITLTLSREILGHAAALAVLLQLGTT